MNTRAFQTVSLLLLATTFASAQGGFSVSPMAALTYAHSDSLTNLFIPDNIGQTTTETVAFYAASFGHKLGGMVTISPQTGLIRQLVLSRYRLTNNDFPRIFPLVVG